jgi:hypothetical protein
MAFAAQQHVQAPVAKTTLLFGPLVQPFAQCLIARSSRSVADYLSICADDLARPSLAHLVGRGEMSDSLPLGGGR